MERLALPWGNARQFTKLMLSLLSHIGKVIGLCGKREILAIDQPFTEARDNPTLS